MPLNLSTIYIKNIKWIKLKNLIFKNNLAQRLHSPSKACRFLLLLKGREQFYLQWHLHRHHKYCCILCGKFSVDAAGKNYQCPYPACYALSHQVRLGVTSSLPWFPPVSFHEGCVAAVGLVSVFLPRPWDIKIIIFT